jgi:hypothetical protein
MGRAREILSKCTFGLIKPKPSEASVEKSRLAADQRAYATQARAAQETEHRPPPLPPYGSP